MRKKSPKKNQKIKIFIIIIILVFLAVIMLISQVFELIKGRNSIKIENIISQEKDKNNEEDEELKFDTFVDKKYTVSELESLTSEEANEILNIQKELLKQNKIDLKRVVGSAENLEEAKKVASDSFEAENNFTIRAKLVIEEELYYVINVSWKYVDEDITNNYEQNVLVFKKFYYNKETNILNLDNAEKIKQVLDIDYYIENYNNSSKCMIQSFVNKDGKKYEYILYYFDITYDNSNQKDKMNLEKEIVSINPETGEIISKNENVIKEGIEIKNRY